MMMACEILNDCPGTCAGPTRPASTRRFALCAAAGLPSSGSPTCFAYCRPGRYLAEFLRTLAGPIVLVGHSYGGNVILMAATGNDQVKRLSTSSWMCDEGESQQQLLERFEGSLGGALDQARAVHRAGRDRGR